MPHGLATTTEETGQQWDAPNGWAPLQWIAIDGLRRHGQGDLAATSPQRWVAENARVYCMTGKLVEKYNVSEAGAGAGGEYPVQDGFGWTNAVLIKLLTIYPELGASAMNSPGANAALKRLEVAGHRAGTGGQQCSSFHVAPVVGSGIVLPIANDG